MKWLFIFGVSCLALGLGIKVAILFDPRLGATTIGPLFPAAQAAPITISCPPGCGTASPLPVREPKTCIGEFLVGKHETPMAFYQQLAPLFIDSTSDTIYVDITTLGTLKGAGKISLGIYCA
jgi:hypothetical protein